MARYIDADLIEYHEEYDGQGFTRVAYADDIESLPTVELIDKERLKFVIEKNFGHGTIEPILQLIDEQPAEDVKPVARGEWIVLSPKHFVFECSNCHHIQGYGEFAFCPFCGSDMRGKTDGKDKQ